MTPEVNAKLKLLVEKIVYRCNRYDKDLGDSFSDLFIFAEKDIRDFLKDVGYEKP